MVSVAWSQPAGGYLANATFPAATLEFAYDGLSRRVQKKTIKNGTAEMEGYVYDGWNVVMISKLNPDDTGAHLARKWSWEWRPEVGSRVYALGSWQEAGGVGGLVWMQTGRAQTDAMHTYQTAVARVDQRSGARPASTVVRHSARRRARRVAVGKPSPLSLPKTLRQRERSHPSLNSLSNRERPVFDTRPGRSGNAG
jgi:hypothetical protein